MLKVNSQVEIGKAKVLGNVVELAPDGKSALVSQEIDIAGVPKAIKQWYSLDMIKEVDLHTEAEDVFKAMESKGLSSQEISDLVSAGGTKFRDKAIEFGILSKEEI